MIKIMIAEDEQKTRNALASRLQGILGDAALIETAEDGNDAVQKALLIQPDLIFMDIEMPFKTGIEATAIIKRQLPQTHVVFLTAYDRFEYAVGALRSGGDDYLLKPTPEADLREVLQKFFEIEEEAPTEITPFETSLKVWLHHHYAEDITLEDAAESMNMSPFYFSRQIKAATGKTFLEYLTAYRMERARKRLLSTELSVSDIGRAVGYSDSNYFTKVFKKAFGCTPTVYRQEN